MNAPAPIEVSTEMKDAGMVFVLDWATENGVNIKPMAAERLAISCYRTMERRRRKYEIIAGATVPRDE